MKLYKCRKFTSSVVKTFSVFLGRHLCQSDETVKVLGRSAFHDTSLNLERSLLDVEWGVRSYSGGSCPLSADISVREMMHELQKEFSERRDELAKILHVDLDWKMHQVSDGERRRVQIFLGLLRPFRVLLLDEVISQSGLLP